MAFALLVATLLMGGLASQVSAQSEPVKPVPVVEPDRSAVIRVPPDEESRSSAANAKSGFTFYVYSDTKLELYYDGGAQFFEGRASGLLLWIDDEVYGPGNIPAGIEHMPYTPLGQTITGDGSFSNPWVVTTTVAAGNTGVKLQTILRYQNGNRIIQLQTTVLNETSTPRNVTLFHAGDIYLQIGTNLPDYGYGTYRAVNNAVGATTSSGDFAFLFEPVNPAPTSYQEGNFAELWKAIGGTKPGPGFNRTFRTGYHDAGAGLQWSLWLTANNSRTVAHQLRLEPIDLTTLDPQIHAPNIEDWSDATPLSRRRFVETYGGGACPTTGECKLDPIAERWYLDNFAFAGALGRCFGLSTMSALFYRDIYHAHDFDVNATVPYSLTRPNAALEERITIYQTLQSDFQVSYPLASTRFNLSPREIYAHQGGVEQQQSRPVSHYGLWTDQHPGSHHVGGAALGVGRGRSHGGSLSH
ncbi:MAG: hypothetical protein IPK16_13995 [Anaerolineales bacterium]|nr:hypothetical protein [Anaerolineales bacterium]